MTTFQIKIIAILTMAIDHIGLFLFPELPILRIIGRLSFPMFAWLIVNGMHYTQNKRSYFARLLGFAIISQLPYLLIHRLDDPTFRQINVFMTLTLGFLTVIIWQKIHNSLIRLYLITFLLIIAYLIPMSYGPAGVLSVFTFYLFSGQWKKLFIIQFCIFFLFFTLPALNIYLFNNVLTIPYAALFQPIAALSIPLISLYNRSQGPKLQYFFYFFYPLHLLILYVMKVLFFQ